MPRANSLDYSHPESRRNATERQERHHIDPRTPDDGSDGHRVQIPGIHQQGVSQPEDLIRQIDPARF